MCLLGYKYGVVRDQILHKALLGFMEFYHMTNRYSYPDKYIKMIPYFLNIVSDLLTWGNFKHCDIEQYVVECFLVMNRQWYSFVFLWNVHEM
jgi:hypothetical protein